MSEPHDDVKVHLEPFLRAAEHYAAGNDDDGFTVLEQRINAEPITDDDDQLFRTWSLISVGALLAGAALRQRLGWADTTLATEDAYYYIHPMIDDGVSVSLDDVASPDITTAIRLVISGANKDLNMNSALIGATWENHGPRGMLLVLSTVVALYATMRPAKAPGTCQCGHPETAHDAEQCWTDPDASRPPDPPCRCHCYKEAPRS